MSLLNEGEVTVTLGRDTYVLKQTLQTFTGLNRLFGGFGPLIRHLVDQDIDAILGVIRVGAGLQGRASEILPRRLQAEGLTADLIVELIRYVDMAANGGKPRPDEPPPDMPEDDAGNV